MFILTQEPPGGESLRAFEALDDAFGTDSFDKASAQQILVEHGFRNGTLDSLVSGGYVSEE